MKVTMRSSKEHGNRMLPNTTCQPDLPPRLNRSWVVLVFVLCLSQSNPLSAQEMGKEGTSVPQASEVGDQQLVAKELVSPERISSSLQIVLVMSVLSLAPAILLMTTSFIRISIVLSLLRQAFGAQQTPSNQVTTSIALFMTLLIMWPVWSKVYYDAIVPYSNESVEWQTAWQAGVAPVREFMIGQIIAANNHDDVLLFARHLPEGSNQPENFSDVPIQALMPAYILSELKTAFFIGFQVYLPFLVIDIVVAAVTMSMGMIMLPPTMISLPLKLLLFVLVDGWRLVVQMLLDSFSTLTYQ